jgi:hypothetical protein
MKQKISILGIGSGGQNITPLKYWHCHYFYGDIAVAENFDHTSEVIDKSRIVLLKRQTVPRNL